MAFKIKVATVHDCEKEIKKMFNNVLDDYCSRFQVMVTNTSIEEIIFCLVSYEENSASAGMTCYAEDSKKIIVQTRDPFLSDWDDNQYTRAKFINILSHEMVHVCQELTGRTGIKINSLKYDKSNEQEAYFFSPCEIEARLFEDPYTEMYGQDLL